MDIFQTFSIMKDIDDLEASDFFTMNSRETRGHVKKIMKSQVSSSSTPNSPFLG